MSTQKRFISQKEALEILKGGDVGILSTVSPDGQPYGVPVHYCFSAEENCIFFHCATSGQKIDNILFSPRVSFLVVGQCEVVPEKITTRYASAMVFGKAEIAKDPREKAEKLRALCVRFAPDTPWAMDESLLKTCGDSLIVKINIDRVTGKRNRP